MNFYIGSSLKNSALVNRYADKLKERGWNQTYDWTKNIKNAGSIEALMDYAQHEKKAVEDADAVIILLPAGRGTHVELGLALALGKKIFLCSSDQKEFDLQNTVNFYQLPGVVRLAGTAGENIEKLLEAAERDTCGPRE